MFDDYLNEQQLKLDALEHKLELICEEIAHASFRINSSDFDFYNDTNYNANFLRELANDLQETNDEICDILDMFFDTTGSYPDTKHYGK